MGTLVSMPDVLPLPTIRVLPEQLANQIAAGEVVERPASVVKELIENSLDAGATEIEVDVEEGGVKRICVRDNGCGITKAQLPLAVCRHATSKIASLDDLQAIASLGFRGEALASIGSVARLNLISRSADDDRGWRLSTLHDSHTAVEPVAHPVGTSLEVCDLFYNTPARRKFLRTDRTEFRHLDEVFRRMALGRFDVAFRLKHNHRWVYQFNAALDNAARLRRLQKLFGKAFVQQSRYLEMQASGLRLWGWLSQPDYSRSQADQQYFYVNGRIIRDRLINHAIRQAYQTLLYPGRQSAYVLHLELDESQVDVNVHPTKHEVRFRESRLIHDFIYKVVSDALSSGDGVYHETVSVARTQSTSSSVRETIDSYRVLTQTPLPVKEQTVLGSWLAVLDNRLWVFQQDQQLVLLDIKRAYQAVCYQRLSQAEQPLPQQPILVPVALTLTDGEMERLEKILPALESWGIELRIQGPNSAMLLKMPSLFRGVEPEAFILDMLSKVSGDVFSEHESVARCLADLASSHLRHDALLENRKVWLAAVAELPASDDIWRRLSTEQLLELLQRG